MAITFKDHSGTITTGGTSQEAMPANTSRRLLLVQNHITETEPLSVNFGSGAASTSAAGSYTLDPGGSLFLAGVDCPTDAVNVTAATTGHKFTAKQG